ncbi:MAG: O-antigen ligase family protein, partial [Thermotogota bacterium]|nr:O-antigen ligase family protein [Thermotogota bacterium]
SFWLIGKLTTGRFEVLHSAQFFFFSLFAWLCIADLINLLRIGTLTELRHVGGRIVFLIFIITTLAVVRKRTQYKRVLQLLMVSVIILSLFTIACGFLNINPLGAHTSRDPRIFWGITMPTKRAIGVPMSYGEYGIIINSVLPLFLMSILHKDFLAPRMWALLGTLVLFLALLVTQSRNSWLATFLAMTFFATFMITRLRQHALKGAICQFGVSTAIIIAIFYYSFFNFIYEGFALGRQAHSFMQRLDSNEIAKKVFFDNWLLGAGHAEISEQISSQLDVDLVVHNGYLDQLASTGLFGFIPFILLILLSFFVLISVARCGTVFWRPYALCLSASLVANMSALYAYKGFFCETFAIEYGLILSLIELNQKDKRAFLNIRNSGKRNAQDENIA